MRSWRDARLGSSIGMDRDALKFMISDAYPVSQTSLLNANGPTEIREVNGKTLDF